MNKLYFYLTAILLFYNINLFSQNPPPWDFNGVDHGFVAQNYASLTIGDTYVTFTLNDSDGDGNAESANSNFKNTDAGIDTSLGGFIAITMKNETANNKMQAILGPPSGTCGCFVNFETLSANDSDFVTHYINVAANSIWTGTLSEITFRFKKGNGINNETFAGDILIDHIEIVDAIPATPRFDYTFDDTTDSEGFSGVNGVTVTQPVAGELNLDIAAQSPYPKLEQTGLYSVDADVYKYVLVTLVNNSPKNKLTLVSPSGGNEYSTVDMVANDGVVQTYELDLTNLTNWNGTQSNWWLQLVENPGDGVVASAGIVDIQQILFSEETTQEPDECPIPVITTWSMTGDGVNFDGTNQDGVTGYQIEYSTSTFTPGDGTATVYEFDAFPHTMTGLQPSTTYYFTVRSICGDNYSEWEQNPDNNGDGPDAYTTTTCPSSYSLPYLNDFNDPVAWTSCQTFYDNDGDGNYWFYTTIDDSDNLTASSFSWNGSAFTPDNWVIMGPIDLTNVSDALLEWEVQALDPAYCNENYSVYVGSSNNYSDLLGSSVSYTETLESGGDACGSWANRSLDISAATGDLVYIGLRHHDVTDVYILSIDNVSVTSSTMSNEDFTLDNIEYTFNQDTNILRITSAEVLSNIQIYNMLGQEVLNNKLNQTSESVDLSDLSSAVYIVNIEGNNSKTKNFKLVVK